jgi:signal transduction histidine kinase/ligand-binding sensor domain-containing protein
VALCWLLASPVRALDPARPLDEHHLDGWTAENGLPGMSVNDVVQTPDGYLWLATYDGLARFDGVRFTSYHTGSSPGLTEDAIRDLAVGPGGELWIATNGGGVSRLSGGRFEHFGPAEGLADPLIWAIHVDPQGRVRAGASTGALYRLEGTRFVREPAPIDRGIGALRGDVGGTLWVGTLGAGLLRRDPAGTWSHVEGPGSSVGALEIDDAGALWVASVAGVARVAGGRVDSFLLGDGAISAPAWQVFRDRQGTLWASGAGGNVARFTGTRFEPLPRRVGLPRTVVSALAADDEGTLWLGTAGHGLFRLHESTFVTRDESDGLPSAVVHSACEGPDGVLYAGTSAGLARLRDGRWETLLRSEGGVRSIAVAPDGTVWVGMEGGLARLSGGRVTRFGEADGLANSTVRAVVVDRRGAVWAATLDGLSRLDGGRWTTWRQADGLPRSGLLGLIETRDGSLWAGTEGVGLVRIQDGHFESIGQSELGSAVVLGLAQGRDGALWAATTRGLALVRDRSVRLLGAAEGIPGHLSQIVEDGSGDLWLGGSAGVMRVARTELDAVLAGRLPRLSPDRFGPSDGLGDAQLAVPAHPPGLRTRDGRLHFPGFGGLSSVDPARLVRDVVAPPVHVEEVLADGMPAGNEAGPGVRRLDFRYTGLCLRMPEQVRFRYQLEGFDPGFVEAGGERVAHYTNLPPGDYRFRVLAASGSGVWNETGASVALRLRPHLWQTHGFLAGSVLALGAGVLLVHRLRVRRLQGETRALESEVAARTRELSEARTRAEALQRSAEQADEAKTRLLGVVAHDLKNPLTTVVGLAQLLETLKPTDLPEVAAMFSQAASRMLRLIDDLLLSSALESGRLVLRREPLDLATLTGEAVDEARRAALRKGISLELTSAEALVEGDADRLRQVVDNLLSNAIKFSSQGQAVRVEVGRLASGVRLQVRDRGPGLRSGDHARLFQAFERLSAQPTGGEPSTGLGLSIVKQLVELHGGRVLARSEGPGLGTTFVVELPA